MRLIEGYRGLGAGDRGASAAIGNFDGVHRGHQVLVADADKARGATGAPLGVITFEPHPRRHFQPDAPPFRLTLPSEKARVLEGLGVERLYQLRFDAQLAGMQAEDFVRDVLVAGLGIAHIVVGADFHFGRGRKGDAVLLRRMGAELGFGLTIHDMIGDEAGEFASTALRVLIEQGRCREAARQLGRWHAVTGRVVAGDRRGRELGYPTANLEFGEQLVPRWGVYAALVRVHDGPHRGRHAGVASIGERPTFGVNRPNFEVHLFDFAGDLYGAEISAGLVQRLRGEERFDAAEALVAQMNRDSAEARAVLATATVPGAAPE
jgi:riboflavin kinase/FMN adenylyltransferase